MSTTMTQDPAAFYRAVDQRKMADTMKRVSALLEARVIDGFFFHINHKGEVLIGPDDFRRICKGAEVEHRGKHGDNYFVSRAESHGIEWVCNQLKAMPCSGGVIVLNEVVL